MRGAAEGQTHSLRQIFGSDDDHASVVLSIAKESDLMAQRDQSVVDPDCGARDAGEMAEPPVVEIGDIEPEGHWGSSFAPGNRVRDNYTDFT